MLNGLTQLTELAMDPPRPEPGILTVAKTRTPLVSCLLFRADFILFEL